jgi:hypothetical protein
MTTTAHGPVDYLLLQVPPGADTAPAAAALLDLVDQGIVRIYDLVVIRKDEDGTFSGIDVNDLANDGVGGFSAFEGARSGLAGEDDLEAASGVMDPGTKAVLIVYENTWAAPFVSAAMDAKAEVIATARIPAPVVMEALEALEASQPEGN